MRLSRRQLVQGAGAVGLGLLVGCGRLPGQGQAPAKVSRVGYLTLGSPDSMPSFLNAFREGLHELGYDEGANIIIEYRYAEGRQELLPDLAAELVRLPVDVIAVGGVEPALAARNMTTTIPIVLTTSTDPVRAGLAASLARPGGNVTGVSNLHPQLTGKRLELLKETVPGLSRLAILWNVANPGSEVAYQEAQIASQSLGLTLQSLAVNPGADFEAAFEAASRERPDALVVLPEALSNTYRSRILNFATANRLPTMGNSDFATDGGFLGYGPNPTDGIRRSATYVDKILRGTRPEDLPVEQPMRFEFVINLRTAQALGLTIPPHILLQATEVIQ